MEIVGIPIKDFYKIALPAARESGFLWTITILAREANMEDFYYNLLKSWSSIDSITGKYFLFICAGKENKIRIEYKRSGVKDQLSNYFIAHNKYIKFLNSNVDLHRPNVKNKYYKYLNGFKENQTMAVNELKEYFSIEEMQIPCLIFTKLYTEDYQNFKIVPIYGNDIYGYFKKIFNQIDPLLMEYTKQSAKLNNTLNKKYEIECKKFIYKIDTIIGDSKMDEDTKRKEINITANVNGRY